MTNYVSEKFLNEETYDYYDEGNKTTLSNIITKPVKLAYNIAKAPIDAARWGASKVFDADDYMSNESPELIRKFYNFNKMIASGGPVGRATASLIYDNLGGESIKNAIRGKNNPPKYQSGNYGVTGM